MTRMVPVIVVVPESAVDLLSEWAEDDDARMALEPLRPTMEHNGWTNEAVLGGQLLRAALNERADTAASPPSREGDER